MDANTSPVFSTRTSPIKRTESIDNGQEILNRQPTILPALQAADVAFVGGERERNLLLRQAVSPSENAQLLPKRRNGLAPRSMPTLDSIGGLPLDRRIYFEEVTLFESLQHHLVSTPLCRPSRIFPVTSYWHIDTSSSSLLNQWPVSAPAG
jgi:hypothetical protein